MTLKPISRTEKRLRFLEAAVNVLMEVQLQELRSGKDVMTFEYKLNDSYQIIKAHHARSKPMVVKVGKRWYVKSETGKNLGKKAGYPSKKAADARLAEVEMFKHMKGKKR